MLVKAFLPSLMLSLVLAGCIGLQTPDAQSVPTTGAVTAIVESPAITAEPTVDPLAAPRAVLAQLTQAQKFRIEDDWTGLSPLAPIDAHYDLRRQGDQFTGKANFSVAGYTRERTAVEEIAIPETIASDFLKMLSETPIEPPRYALGEGPQYEPYMDHTDDYPSIRIEIELKDQTVNFFTSSQGENHVPWAVSVGEKLYIINSDQPMRALKLLAPYLKKDTLRKLIDNTYIGMPTTGMPDPQP